MSKRITVASLSTRMDGFEARLDSQDAKLDAILAAVTPANAPAAPVAAPAPVVAAAPKVDEPNEFVTWLRDTAEQRAARKSSNKEMAAWMRSKGLVPNGPAWEACKKGERSIKRLKALQG